MEEKIDLKIVDKYMQKLKQIDDQYKNGQGRVRFNLSKNPLFLAPLTIIGAIGATIAFQPLLNVYSIITAIPAGLFAYGAPKLIHKMRLNSKGKIGRTYARNRLGEYIDTVYKYNLICNANILKAKDSSEISEEDFEKFSNDASQAVRVYKGMLDKYVAKKINKRVNKDFKKIITILDSKEKFKSAEKKINKIVEKNEKFVEPWSELYNEYGEYAKNLAECVCQIDDKYKMPADKYFYCNPKFLRARIDKYIAENNVENDLDNLCLDDKTDDLAEQKKLIDEREKYLTKRTKELPEDIETENESL